MRSGPHPDRRCAARLIHQADLARELGPRRNREDTCNPLLTRFLHSVLVGLSDTASHGTRPGQRMARLLLESSATARPTSCASPTTSRCAPTSNQAERVLWPSKVP
jgi:transposase